MGKASVIHHTVIITAIPAVNQATFSSPSGGDVNKKKHNSIKPENKPIREKLPLIDTIKAY